MRKEQLFWIRTMVIWCKHSDWEGQMQKEMKHKLSGLQRVHSFVITAAPNYDKYYDSFDFN